jgi:hypothetical protein
VKFSRSVGDQLIKSGEFAIRPYSVYFIKQTKKKKKEKRKKEKKKKEKEGKKNLVISHSVVRIIDVK